MDRNLKLRRIQAVYFDNDQSGFAAKNALELKRLIAPRTKAEMPAQNLKLAG